MAKGTYKARESCSVITVSVEAYHRKSKASSSCKSKKSGKKK